MSLTVIIMIANAMLPITVRPRIIVNVATVVLASGGLRILANGLAKAIGGRLSIRSILGKDIRAMIALPPSLVRRNGRANAA